MKTFFIEVTISKYIDIEESKISKDIIYNTLKDISDEWKIEHTNILEV